MTPQETYTSHLSIPYTSPSLPLRTLDLHIPTTPPQQSPSYTIIYIHGGAFRDPAITSHSIIPSLPHLFFPSSSSAHQNTRTRIAAIASINYRLSPYYPASHHPTDHPSRADDDESRNAKWPDHVHDVRAGIEWLLRSDVGRERAKKKYLAPPLKEEEKEEEEEEEEEAEKKGEGIILVGHSVGATIAFAIALGLDGIGVEGNGHEVMVDAVVGVEGVYDFVALRDAHLESRSVYEEIATGAFGNEESGGWERGNVVKAVGEGKGFRGTEVVVLGHSKGDELVEWGQMKMMDEALREKGWWGGDGGGKVGKGKEVTMMELEGGHDEIWEKGEESV
ncbi:MAG: hypothetical protein Q9185_002090 [Variospora sp. 1 TL-2023]